MATLIPALSTCVARMTQGERRTAERLEQKLDDDYLVWYDVPVGPRHAHPDFVVLHPRRRLLILKVKDWRLETVRTASKPTWDILAQGIPKSVPNSIEQVRHYAHQVGEALAPGMPTLPARSRMRRSVSSRVPAVSRFLRRNAAHWVRLIESVAKASPRPTGSSRGSVI